MNAGPKIAGCNSDTVARTVQDFYERHPYPPPEDSLDGYRERWNDGSRQRAESFLLWPGEPFRDDRSILVAGCGTAQAARHAMRWPNAKVTGIDVSANSIRETKRLRARYKLDNLELRQLPIEEAAELGGEFDAIVSTGVLHHLPDPPTGLRSLREVLAPGGAMQVMLYAPYGRTGVYMMQDYCRMLGIGTGRKAIRDLAETLQALPQDHPLAPLLRNAPDFRSEAGLADALLHPQDRAYSVPQTIAFARDAGLRLGRWLRQAPYLPECGIPASTPHAEALAGLPLEEQYAAMELFRGTMVRHTAILYRDDDRSAEVDFTRGDWARWVPLRVPDTICVEERLPDGAAAVLINRNHTYTDIYLPIDAQEKRWFEAIDGARTIGEIAQGEGDPDKLKAFFARLWAYDQAIFDISGEK